MPAMAPAPLVRGHISERMISGPKAEPKPAQALLTRPSTWESGLEAIITATTPTSTTQRRPIATVSLSEASLRRKSR